jgi:hypothetical protein
MPLPDTVFNHTSPTADTDEARWVACDESGWDGEQLLNGHRHLVYASVAIDDAQAGPPENSERNDQRLFSPGPPCRGRVHDESAHTHGSGDMT